MPNDWPGRICGLIVERIFSPGEQFARAHAHFVFAGDKQIYLAIYLPIICPDNF